MYSYLCFLLLSPTLWCSLSVSPAPLHLSVQYVYALLVQPVTFFYPHAISCKSICSCFWKTFVLPSDPPAHLCSKLDRVIFKRWCHFLGGLIGRLIVLLYPVISISNITNVATLAPYTLPVLLRLAVLCVRHRHEGVRMAPQKYRLVVIQPGWDQSGACV